MSELVFYTNPMSRGRTVRWMLEEVGQPYRTVLLSYAESMVAPEYLAINPMGKVPALRHGGVVVTEAAAICAYLADAFPQAGLAPAPGEAARGDYLRWLFFVANPVENAITTKGAGLVVPPDKERMVGFGTLDRTLDTLEGALRGRDHLAGDRFSATDLFTTAVLGWGMAFGLIDRRPEFERFHALHAARPASRRAAEIDNALMEEARTAT